MGRWLKPMTRYRDHLGLQPKLVSSDLGQGRPLRREDLRLFRGRREGFGPKDCSPISAAGKPMPLRDLSRNLSLSFSGSVSFSSHFCGCWNNNRFSVTTGKCKGKAEFHNQDQNEGKKVGYSPLNF